MRTNVQKNKTYSNTDNNDPDVRHHMRQHINDRCFILASPLRRRQPLNCLRRRTERNGASGELRSFDAATNGGVREREREREKKSDGCERLGILTTESFKNPFH